MAREQGKGFEISLDLAGQVLRVRAWGFWDIEFMEKYNSAFTEKMEELCENGTGWYALMDLTEFYPGSDDVQHLLCQQIAKAKAQGMRKLVYLGKQSVTQRHLNELFLMSDILQYVFVDSEEEALQWLRSE